jgi:hypothetical protein
VRVFALVLAGLLAWPDELLNARAEEATESSVPEVAAVWCRPAPSFNKGKRHVRAWLSRSDPGLDDPDDDEPPARGLASWPPDLATRWDAVHDAVAAVPSFGRADCALAKLCRLRC